MKKIILNIINVIFDKFRILNNNCECCNNKIKIQSIIYKELCLDCDIEYHILDEGSSFDV